MASFLPVKERGEVFPRRREENLFGLIGPIPEEVAMVKCGGKRDGGGDETTEGGGEGLKEVDLGIHGQFLFEEIVAEASRISGGVGDIDIEIKKNHFDKGGRMCPILFFYTFCLSS